MSFQQHQSGLQWQRRQRWEVEETPGTPADFPEVVDPGAAPGAAGLLHDRVLLSCLLSLGQIPCEVPLVVSTSAATNNTTPDSSCLIAI